MTYGIGCELSRLRLQRRWWLECWRGPLEHGLACWAMGQKNCNSVRWGKKYFFTGPTRAAKAEKRSLVPVRTNQRRKDPFHLYSLRPHSPQFQQSAGATLLNSLSGGQEGLIWPWFDCDGRSVLPALLDHTICSGKSCLAASRRHFSSCCYLEQKIVS
jgi:hypothetical protein